MTAPRIYNFHPLTGVYTGMGFADPSPLEPGVWLDPADSTRVAPPNPGAGKVAVWNDVAWAIVPAGSVSPPETPPTGPVNPYPDLKPYQFWGAVRSLGYDVDLQNWIAGITDPIEKGVASAMLDFSQEFRRDHSMIENARLVLGMTKIELDALWLWALTL